MDDEMRAIIKNMYDAVKSDSDDKIAKRDSELIILMSFNDSAAIEPILMMLDDNDEFFDESYTLIHAAESFPDDVYIDRLLNCICGLEKMAPWWAGELIMRIANSAACSLVLVNALKSRTPETTICVIRICSNIRAKNTTSLANIHKLLDELAVT